MHCLPLCTISVLEHHSYLLRSDDVIQFYRDFVDELPFKPGIQLLVVRQLTKSRMYFNELWSTSMQIKKCVDCTYEHYRAVKNEIKMNPINHAYVCTLGCRRYWTIASIEHFKIDFCWTNLQVFKIVFFFNCCLIMRFPVMLSVKEREFRTLFWNWKKQRKLLKLTPCSKQHCCTASHLILFFYEPTNHFPKFRLWWLLSTLEKHINH